MNDSQYSGKEVEGLESAIDKNIAVLLDLVGKYASEHRPMDFGRKAQYFKLDVISSVAYGDAFGYLASDSDVHDYIKSTEETFKAAMMVTVLPWLN